MSSIEELEFDRRKKWKYSELLERFKNLLTKTAKSYIPELFEALRDEHPDWTKDELMSRIVIDLKGIVSENTIDSRKPNWMKKYTVPHRKSSSIYRTSEDKERSARQSGIETFEKAGQEIPEDEEDSHDEEEQTVGKGKPLDEWEEEHPEIEISPFERIGEVNKSLDRLWKALTGLRYMPTTEDNVRAEYIIPTRQFRRDFIKGSKKIERTYLHNWIEWVQMAMKDAADIIESIDEK